MLDERFWSKVEKTPDCWVWKSTRRTDGYGVFWYSPTKRQERAHRLAYEDAEGPIPAGMSLLHRCDNPPCVRPAHLFVGTQADNMADMTEKGRRSTGPRHAQREQSGEANHMARLTAERVADIRAMGLAGYYELDIAERFGVTKSNVGLILRGETWRGIAPSETLSPVERPRYRAKLGLDAARAARASYTGRRGDITRLAREYGVSVTAMQAIIRGRSYPEP